MELAGVFNISSSRPITFPCSLIVIPYQILPLVGNAFENQCSTLDQAFVWEEIDDSSISIHFWRNMKLQNHTKPTTRLWHWDILPASNGTKLPRCSSNCNSKKSFLGYRSPFLAIPFRAFPEFDIAIRCHRGLSPATNILPWRSPTSWSLRLIADGLYSQDQVLLNQPVIRKKNWVGWWARPKIVRSVALPNNPILLILTTHEMVPSDYLIS